MNNQNENKKQLMKDIWNNIPQDNRNLKRLCIADVEQLAQIADKQGYRKQTDVIKEFVGRLMEFACQEDFSIEENFIVDVDVIKEIAAEYGVEV